MLWARDTPVVVAPDADGRVATVTVVAGELDGHRAPAPPPDSWASRPDAGVAIWHLRLEPHATWSVPAARAADVARVLYVYRGGGRVGDASVEVPTGVVVQPDVVAPVQAGPTAPRC